MTAIQFFSQMQITLSCPKSFKSLTNRDKKQFIPPFQSKKSPFFILIIPLFRGVKWRREILKINHDEFII
jgi:hypothetical protein